MSYEPYDHFEVVTPPAGEFWVVRRLRDGKPMAFDRSVKTCLKWLRSWGPDRT